MTEAATLEELAALKLQVQAARAERDAAVSALDRIQLEAVEQQRLLVEEQDRFVTRIIEKYEQQIARLKGEHDAAVSIAEQLRHKSERFRRDATRAEEELALKLCELEARGKELQEARRTAARLMEERTPNSARIAHLESELELARMLLQSALESPVRQPNSSADGAQSSRH